MRCKDVASLLAPLKSSLMVRSHMKVNGTTGAGMISLSMQYWASPPTVYSRHVSRYMTSICSQIQYGFVNVCGALHIDSCTQHVIWPPCLLASAHYLLVHFLGLFESFERLLLQFYQWLLSFGGHLEVCLWAHPARQFDHNLCAFSLHCLLHGHQDTLSLVQQVA